MRRPVDLGPAGDFVPRVLGCRACSVSVELVCLEIIWAGQMNESGWEMGVGV